MDRLIANFYGYLRLYQLQIVPCLVIGCLIEIFILFIQRKRNANHKNRRFKTILCGIFLSLSIALVITMTLYGRTGGTEFAFRFRLFGSYIEAFQEHDVEVLLQIIMNVVMFVPLGFFLPCCFHEFQKNHSLFSTTFLFSWGIEIIQGVSKIGMFEVDDILGNVVGAEIGFCLYRVSWNLRKRRNR